MPNDASALIAAVRAGDTDAAEKLLAAGAPPDARDETGYTALGLATVRADTEMCDLLVRSGADVDLRCPGGLTPIMLAADCGAIGAWNRLCAGSPDLSLRDDLGRDAMDIARAWLGVDPAAELLRRLGAADGDEARTTREPAPDEGIGSFETVRVTTRTATASVQTGHAAILTDAEERHGIRVPYYELADRALAFDPEHACRFYPAYALSKRLDDETLALAARDLEAAPDPDRRRFAAEVLLTYGVFEGDEDEAVVRMEQAAAEVLRHCAAGEEEPEVVAAIVWGLGLHSDLRAVPEILRRAGHPDPEVRRQVALALQGMVGPGDTEALRTVIALTEDPDRQVRRYAANVLSDTKADTPVIRASLTRLMDDPDPDVAVEGARGLALRDDLRADIPLVRAYLSRADDSLAESHRAYDAIRRMPMERFLAARAVVESPGPAA
ncbi:HEAT repeat domain-containing protein [Actinacidiphila bryophytorum]|uniref:HEAT repeat domain-containing protein n=1 Tax=Actinacidiphila bryophytorum TaxID=1436133 RepID=UPI002176DD9A|nr:HEAT repeat domain-containing protein [Actinacidiphila bryophytorum]UWE11774.1 HEAT repeat domain-containing protein [Actinacidiphila bryophytorum]